jgi:foldase protein PrsA
MLLGAVGILLVIVAGVLAFGYWNAVIKPRNRTVLEADGIKISYSAMRRRMGYEYSQGPNASTFQQGGQAVSVLGEAAYKAALDEITLVTRAESDLGITLTDDEVQQDLRTQVGVAADATNQAVADALKKQLNRTGLTEAEYRRMLRANLLSQKVTDKFTTELPATTAQAKFDLIQADTQDNANNALLRVDAGQDWATVAKDTSQESDVATSGGLHDYTPLDLVDATYESFVSTANPGDTSQVLPNSNGSAFYIVRLVDRSDQPVRDTDKPALANKKYSDWLTNTQESMSVFRDWDTQAQSDALAWVGANILPKVREQQIAAQATQAAASSAAATAQALQPTPGTPAAQATPGTPESQPTSAAPGSAPTAAATTGGGSTPAAPSQPVAPGNGQ